MGFSPPFDLQQSIPVCCTLAVIGGLFEVAATAVTAVPSARNGGVWHKHATLAGNVVLQLIGSTLSHMIATWFGPVSIVVPFYYASTLLSNMFIFGGLLQLESFPKITRAGTLVIVVGTMLLPQVGPAIQEDQDINQLLLGQVGAMVWLAVLLTAMAVTGVLVGFTDLTKHPVPYRMLVLLVARAASISLNLTVSRGFICHPTHSMFVFLVLLKLVSGAVYTYAIVVQSTAVDQARFVPLNTSLIVLTNAFSGIVVWQDYKVVGSWYGYAAVFCLLGIGCDLLLHKETTISLTTTTTTTATLTISDRTLTEELL